MAAELIYADLKLRGNLRELLAREREPPFIERSVARNSAPEAEHRDEHVDRVQNTVQRPQRLDPRRVMVLAFDLVLFTRLEKSSLLFDSEKRVVVKLVDERTGQHVLVGRHRADERARQLRGGHVYQNIVVRLERDGVQTRSEM